jgi:hypothetical protein
VPVLRDNRGKGASTVTFLRLGNLAHRHTGTHTFSYTHTHIAHIISHRHTGRHTFS